MCVQLRSTMFATVTNVEHPQARGMVSKVVCVSIMMALVVLASGIINWATGVTNITGPSNSPSLGRTQSEAGKASGDTPSRSAGVDWGGREGGVGHPYWCGVSVRAGHTSAHPPPLHQNGHRNNRLLCPPFLDRARVEKYRSHNVTHRHVPHPSPIISNTHDHQMPSLCPPPDVHVPLTPYPPF